MHQKVERKKEDTTSTVRNPLRRTWRGLLAVRVSPNVGLACDDTKKILRAIRVSMTRSRQARDCSASNYEMNGQGRGYVSLEYNL